MEASTIFLTLFLVALTLFPLLSYFVPRKLKLPPGPKPWPVVGNINIIGSLPTALPCISAPPLVASSPKIAKIILQENDVIFASRPKTAARKYTTYNYSDMAWSSYGLYWVQLRKICEMEIFSGRRLDAYQYIRVEEMRKLMKRLYISSGKLVMLKDDLIRLTFNLIGRMALVKSYLEGEMDNSVINPEEFKFMIEELFVLSVFNIGDFISWLGVFDLQGYAKRMKDVSKKLDKFLELVIVEQEHYVCIYIKLKCLYETGKTTSLLVNIK